MLLNNLDQARELLATLEPGCGDQKQAKYRAALDYSREMYAKGGERYLQHVEKIGFTGGRVLDVGCGAGHWCLALAQHNHEVVGLDANSEYIDIARFVAANFANGQRLHLFTGVAEELSYPDGHFDYLVCHGVLMFTEHELALSEFRRILKPDGRLYLGYSGLGWYLRYLLEDGIANGNEARLRKGAAVLSASFKFAAGFRSVGELWLSLPPAILNELVEATGFKINGHPGIQDIKMDGFLGLEAPYDLLATAGATEQTEPATAAELKSRLQHLIDIWRPRAAIQLLKETGGDQLDDQSRSLLQVRALLKMAEFAGAERILSGLKSTSSEVRYLKAMLAHGQRDFKRALTHYAAADVLADTEYLLAECYRESGDLDKATELFRKLLAQDSQSLRTWVGLICSSKSRDEMKSITCEYLMTIKPELENAGEVDQLLAKLNQSNPEPQAEGKKSTPQPTGARERDLKPRRRVRKILPADPFMKLVPVDAPAKTDGLRILLLADFNIAGQMTRIMRALNRYTNHAARCVILEDDYLSYDRDLVLVDGDGRADDAAHEEAAELARKADFYHIGRQPFALPGIDWNLVLRQNNTLFQYFGSYLRDNADHIRRLHAGRKFTAITAMEWTMYRALPNGFYHIQPYMIEPDELPQVDWQKAGPIRICHAPSNAYYRQIKGSDLIVEVMERLARERNDVEIDLIENVSNAECLQRKRDCHLHLVALRYGFGLNAVESAALGMVPLVQLPNFVRAAYPDTPVQHVTATTLYDKTIELLSDRRQLAELGEACRQWAQREFSARNLIRKYWYLYDFIYHGLSVDYPHPFVEEFVVTAKQAVEIE